MAASMTGDLDKTDESLLRSLNQQAELLNLER